MPDILTRSGRHVWVEIRSGTVASHTEAFYCLKCGEQAVTGDWSRTPVNAGCTQGDRVVDMSPLHRQPARLRADEPSGDLMVTAEVPWPSWLLGVSSGRAFQPVLFHPERPGFVLADTHAEATQMWQVFEAAGFRLPQGMQVSLIRMPRHVLDALQYVRGLVTPRACGVYWRLRPGDGQASFLYAPLEETHA